MKRSSFAIAFTALLILGITTRAQAQAPPIELNAHVGALFIDTPEEIEGDTDPMYGIRLGYNTPGGFGFAGNLDWIPGERNLFGSDVDINTYLYSGEVNYTFPSSNPVHFFLAGGVGAATRTFSDIPGEDSIEGQTDLMIPVGAGIKWLSGSNTWGIRAEVRDNIVFETDIVDVDIPGVEEDTEARNHIEVSGGVSFFFGG